MVEKQESHIVVKDITLAYGSNVVQQNVSFTVNRGDVFIIMGGSGCGEHHHAGPHRAQAAIARRDSL
jgi:phospholipid/cholesterol/gamma-HCH transport system ATP-binding protein